MQKFPFSDQINVKHNAYPYNNAKCNNHRSNLRTKLVYFGGIIAVFARISRRMRSQLLENRNEKEGVIVKRGTVMYPKRQVRANKRAEIVFSIKLTARRRFGQNTCEAVKKNSEAARLAVYIVGETLLSAEDLNDIPSMLLTLNGRVTLNVSGKVLKSLPHNFSQFLCPSTSKNIFFKSIWIYLTMKLLYFMKI